MNAFKKLVKVFRILRQKCPWDREQTHHSLRKYIIEEAYELVEAVESENSEKVMDELADILTQVMLHTVIAEENGEFDFDNLLEHLIEKIERRHPHVFGEIKVKSKEDVIKNWIKIKGKEKESVSVMDNIPHIPGLLLSAKIQRRASALGFDWENIKGVYEKIEEEIDELKNAKNDKSREEELGDLLFAVSHLSNFLGIDPEIAINRAIRKFVFRFKVVEKEINRSKTKLSIDEMEKIWQNAKQRN